MSTLPAEDVLQGTIGADGTATVRSAPVPPWKRLTVRRLAVESDSALRTAATVYKNTPAPSNLIDTTPYSGNGDSTDTVMLFQAGESVVIQWTGGTPGARVTATYSGQLEDQG